jgi:hypothetical protein
MEKALEVFATCPPDVFNHNLETYPQYMIFVTQQLSHVYFIFVIAFADVLQVTKYNQCNIFTICGKLVHVRMFLLRWDRLAHKTSLEPVILYCSVNTSLGQESEQSSLCVSGRDFVTVSTIIYCILELFRQCCIMFGFPLCIKCNSNQFLIWVIKWKSKHDTTLSEQFQNTIDNGRNSDKVSTTNTKT